MAMGQTTARKKKTKKKKQGNIGAGVDEDLQHVELTAGLITPSASPTLLDEMDVDCLFGC